jgi:hypothetical protein
MKRSKPPPQKIDPNYRQLWRVVDGAVADAIKSHPEFFTLAKRKTARYSIAKRVTGGIHGYLVQAGWGRSGEARRPER